MSKPQTLTEHAIAFARRGWCAIPIKADKRPYGAWKQYQNPKAAKPHLSRWLSVPKQVTGIGIICGKASSDLYVRDFDVADSYTRWAAQYPHLARTMPTVLTTRGYHVYGCWPGVRTRKLGDGELRGEGSYVVAPPSIMESGHEYEWFVPLPEGDLPQQCPEACGLNAAAAVVPESGMNDQSATESTERTEGTESTEKAENPESTQDTEDTEDREDAQDEQDTNGLYAILSEWIAANGERLHAIYMRTLPKTNGTRNESVFRLVRALKAIPELAQVDPARVLVLKPICRAWFDLAERVVSTKDFGTSWGDFIHAWQNVKWAEGEDLFSRTVAKAKASTMPGWAADYDPRHALLGAICRDLQRSAGDQPFYLAARKAGDAVGVEAGQASRWLKAMTGDGVLDLVEQGKQGGTKASRYRYLADDL